MNKYVCMCVSAIERFSLTFFGTYVCVNKLTNGQTHSLTHSCQLVSEFVCKQVAKTVSKLVYFIVS